jgi:hypothetical protein
VPQPEGDSIPDRVREACSRVAGAARSVTIDEEAIEPYARRLEEGEGEAAPDPAAHLLQGDRELRAAFGICLGAVNFGSGWWPTIRKRPGRSGYFTIAEGLAERFRRGGAWTAAELASLSTAEVGATFGQDPDHPLMADFATALRDVGENVAADHGGRFAAVADAAAGSAVELAGILAGWRAFEDVSRYEGAEVPFYKRAQLVPTDLARAGVISVGDEERLTAFADNLVPHVLRLDGVLGLDAELAAAIDAGRLLVHGSREEVELRACAVQAVELLSAATGGRLWPARIDAILWNRGRSSRYKAVPRPRSRNTAY